MFIPLLIALECIAVVSTTKCAYCVHCNEKDTSMNSLDCDRGCTTYRNAANADVNKTCGPCRVTRRQSQWGVECIDCAVDGCNNGGPGGGTNETIHISKSSLFFIILATLTLSQKLK